MNELRRTLDAAQSEDEFAVAVVDAAKLAGYTLRYHVHDARRSNYGFPDWHLLRPATGDLVVLELKRERDRTPPRRLAQQQAWIDGYAGVRRVRALLARPSDWDAVLAALSEGGL